MVVRGELLTSRVAIVPGLAQIRWPTARERRAWAALGSGARTSERLLQNLAEVVRREGLWQPMVVARYRVAAGNVPGDRATGPVAPFSSLP